VAATTYVASILTYGRWEAGVSIIKTAILAAGVAIGIGLAGCATRDAGGKGTLPPPPAAAAPSPYTPEHPLQPAPGGSASRDVVRVDSGRGYAIEVRDYLIPLDKEVTVDLGGPAMVEVRHGGGEATIGGASPQKIAQGAVFTVPDDQTLRVTARGEPMTLRAWIYR
jgi:hypothetical protein